MTIMRNPQSNLPPGFRFHPTDEELILHYLRKKVTSSPVPVSIIADVDIYKFDPWDLPVMAPFGEKEWYFFSPRDRKYPNGARPNRAAGSGYWKATGTDKIISAVVGRGIQETVGVKKALVFYKGRPPKGVKTNWIMHEYRLTENISPNHTTMVGHRIPKPRDSSMRLDDWVLCRIYQKTHASPLMAANAAASDQDQEEEEQLINQEPNHLVPSMPEINDDNYQGLKPQKSCSFSNLLDAADLSILSSFLSENQTIQPAGFEFPPPLATSSSPDQPLYGSYGNHYGGSDFLGHRLPQLCPASPEKIETGVKRQFEDRFEEDHLNPSKKMMGSCSLSNGPEGTSQQYGFVHQSILNQQQLLLSPYLQYQG